MTTLVELCAGSAALARYLTGGWRLVSYAGSKDGYTHDIADVLGLCCVDRIVLADPGLWNPVWRALSVRGGAALVADVIDDWADGDARSTWDWLQISRPRTLTHLAARSLCLIAGTYGGHERGGFKGSHKRRPNVDGFIPKRETIAKRLRAIPELPPITIYERAHAVAAIPGAICYIDPPYRGRTGYLNDLGRSSVLDLARYWADSGATVGVSEAEPLEELDGFERVLHARRSGQNRKNTRSAVEWLTYRTQ